MPLSQDAVRSLFAHSEARDGSAFFDHVDDDVDWTVEGHHPLAGRYRGKAEFRAHTFERLGKVLPGGAQLHVTSVLISGLRFDNKYCWVTHFAEDKIIEVRAYLDSAMVQRLFDENPGF